MLQLLHIENIALIEKADIEFGMGLSVLTGETGAGKSIVIDALSAVTGGRTSRELIRTGADAAVITAVFSGEAADKWCAENDATPEEDGSIFLMRKITSDGKNTCRVNGMPVSVGQLRELGEMLLDIHGQNDGRRLLDEQCHREYLDKFGDIDTAEYEKTYRQFKAVENEIESLTLDESEMARKIDNLKFQIEELRRAEITVGEYDEKLSRRELLKNASKLIESVDLAFCALYGEGDTPGVVDMISEAESSVTYAAKYSENMQDLAGRLSDLRYSAQAAAEELRDFRADLDFSPEELDALEGRLSLLSRLMRKYGGSEEAMLEYLAKCEDELDTIEFSSDRIEKLEKQLVQLREETANKAHELSEERKSAAESLKQRIEAELSHLNMAGVYFCVELCPVNTKEGFGAHGCDEIRFLMSANAGEDPGRISKIASGGELSRIMLAMKNVLANNDEIGTMVFDEIDTGVSGIAAQRVGEKLYDLARQKQVICVTHLPQIAVMSDIHFAIDKRQEKDRTFTYINMLDFEGRKHEIARLAGGENVTDTMLASAEEQLKSADKYKKSI